MSDPFRESIEVQREDPKAFPTGIVYLDQKKTGGFLSCSGALNFGLTGITVMKPNGTAVHLPWRVINYTDIEAEGHRHGA